MSEASARAIVGVRADGRCEVAIPNVCTGGADTVHHRRKRRFKDTLWSVSNLIVACGDGARGCHGWVEAHPTFANADGLWLFGHQVPTAEAVHLRVGGRRSWWLLDDEGTATWVNGADFEDIVYSTAVAGAGPSYH